MRYFPCILFFLLIFCSCGKSKESKEECREKLKQQEVQLENLRILSKLQHYGEGKRINNVFLYLGKEDSISLEKTIGCDEKFVFYFSQYSCSSCYQPFWNKVLKYKNEWKEKMVILAFFETEKEFRMFMDGKDTNIPVYRISEGLQLFSDYDDYSYVFKTTSSLNVDNLLLLNHSNVEYMDDYLSICGMDNHNSLKGN